eukprot:1360956-Rhodomonas_salina.2
MSRCVWNSKAGTDPGVRTYAYLIAKLVLIQAYGTTRGYVPARTTDGPSVPSDPTNIPYLHTNQPYEHNTSFYEHTLSSYEHVLFPYEHPGTDPTYLPTNMLYDGRY